LRFQFASDQNFLWSFVFSVIDLKRTYLHW